MSTYTTVATLEDLAPFEERIIEVVLDWCGEDGDPIDWESMLERIERYLELDLPTDFGNPVLKRIKKIGRAAAADTFG